MPQSNLCLLKYHQLFLDLNNLAPRKDRPQCHKTEQLQTPSQLRNRKTTNGVTISWAPQAIYRPQTRTVPGEGSSSSS